MKDVGEGSLSSEQSHLGFAWLSFVRPSGFVHLPQEQDGT